jgi:hypothetical protein
MRERNKYSSAYSGGSAKEEEGRKQSMAAANGQ